MKNKVILICLICIFLVSTSVGALYYQTHESYDRLVHFFFKNMFKEPSVIQVAYVENWAVSLNPVNTKAPLRKMTQIIKAHDVLIFISK